MTVGGYAMPMASVIASRHGKLCLDANGARRFRAVLDTDSLAAIRRWLSVRLAGQPGVRLFGLAGLQRLMAADGALGTVVASEMVGVPRPVRAILFDKTASTNWALGWHQDRVIAVRRRIEVEGFGPWTRKHGALHVAPPFEILARMMTLRLHLDTVPETNAPLLIAPGSHRYGRIAGKDVLGVIERCGIVACLADPGDAWLYATPILHASEVAHQPGRRRVLQVDYAVGDLPGGLEWLGL